MQVYVYKQSYIGFSASVIIRWQRGWVLGDDHGLDHPRWVTGAKFIQRLLAAPEVSEQWSTDEGMHVIW